MLITTIRFTFTPLATAALAEAPVARRSKPNRVRLTRNQKPDADRGGEHDQPVHLQPVTPAPARFRAPARTAGSAWCRCCSSPAVLIARRSGVSR